MLSRLLPFVLAATPALAQFDFSLEKATSGRLGDSLDLQVIGAPPLSILLHLASTTSGPTPLSLIDASDLRVLSVGADLLGSMGFGLTDAAGSTGFSIALPTTPSLAGAELHWQSIQLLLGASFFGAMSNDVVTLLGAPDTGVVAPATLNNARAFAATALNWANNPSANDLLVAGGGGGTLTAATGLATTELWDYRRMRFVPGPTMSSARALHLSVQLNDGRTLMIGGADAFGGVLATCEIYDPVTNTFTNTGSMTTPRILHAACLLADGRVLVCGGTSTLTPDVVAAIGGTLNSAEIYNPGTGTWTSTSNIGGRRLGPALTLLPNGQAMVSGGVEVGLLFGIPISAASTTAVQRWNPGTGSWTSGPNMAQGRAGHQYNQVRLNDGRILMTGGVNVPNLVGATTAAPINGAEVYNPATNSWATFNMPSARALHSATVLGDGRVAVCGGAQGTLLAPVSIANVDVFNPASNSWTSAPALTGPRASHAAGLMPDGTLVLIGGQGATTTVPTVETVRF